MLNRFVRWFRFAMKKREFHKRITALSYAVAMGKWYVWRDEPTWMLLWMKKFGPPDQERMDRMGMSKGAQSIIRETYAQSEVEFNLRFRPVAEMMRELLKRQGVPDHMLDDLQPANLMDFEGDDVMLGILDPVEHAKKIMPNIEDMEVKHETWLVDEATGEHRQVTAEEFERVMKEEQAKRDAAANDAVWIRLGHTDHTTAVQCPMCHGRNDFSETSNMDAACRHCGAKPKWHAETTP